MPTFVLDLESSQCVAISHWSSGFSANEEFPSKQMYLNLSLVERKVADLS